MLTAVMVENGFQDISKFIRHRCFDSSKRKTPARIKLECDISVIRAHILNFVRLTNEKKTNEFDKRFVELILEKLNKIQDDYNCALE
jgi:hypothetical protein